jgi:NAD(P)H-dependent flavin oxidoreductase YrpB (nitropropane dioxygenase family)
VSFLLVVVIAVIVLGALVALKAKQPLNEKGLAFDKREPLFTPAERSFLGVLEQALGSRYRVLGKVRLGDIVKPAKGLGKSKRATANNKINQKHLDFVVCTAADLSVVGVVELDDKSHEKEARAGRDELVDLALSGAKVPIVHFSVKSGYAVQEVRAKLVDTFKLAVEQPLPTLAKEEAAEKSVVLEVAEQGTENAAPICPKCAAVMQRKQAMKGPHAGKWFWACPAFPACRQILDIQ